MYLKAPPIGLCHHRHLLPPGPSDSHGCISMLRCFVLCSLGAFLLEINSKCFAKETLYHTTEQVDRQADRQAEVVVVVTGCLYVRLSSEGYLSVRPLERLILLTTFS